MKKVLVLACAFSLFAQTFFRPMKNERNEKANEKKAFEDRSNNNVSQKKPIISLLVLFLKTHRKRRSGLKSRARLFWTLPSGEEVRRVERKERRDFGERESASEEI